MTLRVLIVEDEIFIAMLVEDMLAELGCKAVATVSQVGAALDAVERGGFDFAVLDVNLGGERSFPIAHALRQRGIPFLFATGYGTDGIPPDFEAVTTLQKPFALEELRRAVDAARPAAL